MSEIARILLLGLAIPASVLLAGSVLLFLREKTLWSSLQLFGAGFLTVVVLTHVAEKLRLFPSMHWGLPHSVGHYVDLWSAALGLTLFPIGYFLDALTARRAESMASAWVHRTVQTPVNPGVRLYGKPYKRKYGCPEQGRARGRRTLPMPMPHNAPAPR
jgi:hypothetical protein